VLCGVLSLGVAVDYVAAPFPLWTVEIPRIYQRLSAEPAQRGWILCELPMGIRDGFGERGQLDPAMLYYQTFHHHPLVGGFVARMSHRVRDLYLSDPALGPLLALSARPAPRGLPVLPLAASRVEEGLRRLGVRYVMLNRSTASPELAGLVHRMPGLTRVAGEGARELFTLGPQSARSIPSGDD